MVLLASKRIIFDFGYSIGTVNKYAEMLEQTMEIADSGAVYIQQDIVIYDNCIAVAHRAWRGVAYDHVETEDNENEIISFVSFGYYGAREFFSG